MIKNSKQNWTVGQTVKVGFMQLVVRAAVTTPGDGMPDCYFLSNVAGTKLYEFVPHHGLNAVSIEEATAKIVAFRKQVELIAHAEAAKAIKAAQINARFNELFVAAQFQGHDTDGMAVYSGVVV